MSAFAEAVMMTYSPLSGVNLLGGLTADVSSISTQRL
jgi:hypothetical protein